MKINEAKDPNFKEMNLGQRRVMNTKNDITVE